MAEDKPITVEEVRSAQGCLKNGITLHEKKSFKPFLQNFLKLFLKISNFSLKKDIN